MKPVCPTVACKVCGSAAPLFGSADILRKYSADYFRCERCGFLQTEAPFWLEESYSSAIARQDVGIMRRNLVNCELTSAVLNLMFPEVVRAVDYGAGHGIFVRLMRDKGFDFCWMDRYATNDYARGFEYEPGTKVEFLTAFEVLEHLPNPVEDLAPMMELADNVFVSTILVPEPAPGIADWWYYSPTTGQHVAFYTPRALQILADRFGRKLLSHGAYHLFTKEPKSEMMFGMAARFRAARVVNRMYRREALIDRDYQTMLR